MKNVAVIIDALEIWYQFQISQGIKKIAEEKGFNLLFFCGMQLKSVVKDTAQHNVIYQHINVDKLDGIIVLAGTLENYITKDELNEFLKDYKKIPMVTTAVSVPGVPGVIFDNKTSIKKVLEHLIEHHNYKKIAYISGPYLNEEARIRYDAYIETLQKYNIPFDKNYVYQGTYYEESGYKAVEYFLEEKGLQVDAIYAASDEMAIGALLKLQSMGIRVPEDIAIAGFDDIEKAKMFTPRLTTISQSVSTIGNIATNLLGDLMEGKKVPLKTCINGELIIRESCGCFNISKDILSIDSSIVVNTSSNYKKECEIFEKKLLDNKQDIILDIINNVEISKNDISDFRNNIDELLECLIDDIQNENENGKFIIKINSVVNDCINIKKCKISWSKIMYKLEEKIIDITLNNKMLILVEDIFNVSNGVIKDIYNRRDLLNQYYFKKTYIKSREVVRNFNLAFYLKDIKIVIKDAMKSYGIKEYYLCLYDNPMKNIDNLGIDIPAKINLVLGRNKEEIITDIIFDSKDLLPEKYLYSEERKDLLLFPLFSGQDHYGYIVYDFNAVDELIYETVREQISISLRSQMLFNERKLAEEKLSIAIKELENYNKKLHNISDHDELTSLYNRRGFFTRGESYYNISRQTNESFTLFYADLDKFKNINDVYGHFEGDEALKITAKLLKDSFRGPDIISRMGGDEFTMIALNIFSLDEVYRILSRINEKFEDYNEKSNKPYKLSISIGYSIFDSSKPESFDDLIKDADIKLYEEKKRKAK
ncbi:MAG: diguanylate cyclase [Clostridiaceae bacterium]